MGLSIFVITVFLGGAFAVPALVGPFYQTNDYYTYEEIGDYLDGLAWSYSNRVVLKEIGVSYENRTLRTITISNGDGRPGKNVIFIDAGFHAREWLAHTTALNIINELVVNYDKNKDLLDDYEWIILPLVNPDGYTYSRSDIERIDWRKNRKPSGNGCIGTDLNRNFEVGWGAGDASDDPCNFQLYRGEAPFTEPESQTIQRVLLELTANNRGKLYLSIHSYGAEILYPWSYAKETIKNYKEHLEIAEKAIQAISKTSRPSKYVARPGNAMYVAGGSSMDYAYKVGFPLSFVWELPGIRGNEEFKFYPPKYLIRELVRETWVGVRAMAKNVIKYYPTS
ncbi:carboxypeptidase B-like [Drosophila ananassae]|uniref:carboxypeptidase B-like n=1 Tax=Drosophila ananassae TaxID=7217 RepID=UPI0013A5C0F5|nr:carboxypeptidase B-like [Drosophila ananassae]